MQNIQRTVFTLLLFTAGWTQLHTSDLFELAKAENDNVEAVKKFVQLHKKELDLNAVDYKENTALHYACEKGNLEIVRFFITQGVDLNLINSADETALLIATDNRYVKIVKLLIENDADIRIEGSTKNIFDLITQWPLELQKQLNNLVYYSLDLTSITNKETQNLIGKRCKQFFRITSWSDNPFNFPTCLVPNDSDSATVQQLKESVIAKELPLLGIPSKETLLYLSALKNSTKNSEKKIKFDITINYKKQ